jgi:hypothetical protein
MTGGARPSISTTGARVLGSAGPETGWSATAGEGEAAGGERLGSKAGLRRFGLEIKTGQKWVRGRRNTGEGFSF